MNDLPPDSVSFSDFSFDDKVLKVIAGLGFETPTPIQARAIPLLLQGSDLVGQAQTGTGKTAAFGLPLISVLTTESRATQALVVTPTRELALQVAGALGQFAAARPGLRVVAIYGGQAYGPQLSDLRRGAHIVVGTPGRVMDHMRRGSLKLDELKTVVLDEADEMLNMGFVDDMEWILGNCPAERQTCLFSATMPPRIRSIAAKYMRSPASVHIERHTSAAETIRQRQWLIRGLNKLDALSRVLEAEPLDAALIFVRTRTATVELAEQLSARGFLAGALHGDMPQGMREHMVKRLEGGKIDLLVATDVAARGLDIERFSHVINYDMPSDAEAYVHRIGRTGRAGREGQAISFVAPRERHLLRAIERMTKQPVEAMALPSADQLNEKRIAAFRQGIIDTVAAGELEPFASILRELCADGCLEPLEVAAALALKAQGKVPLLLRDVVIPDVSPTRGRTDRSGCEPGMEQYRLAVGQVHGVNPSHIVGAIANEAGLQSRHIGRITIEHDHSLVDLPEGMPRRMIQLLRRVRVCRVPLQIQLVPGQSARGLRKSFLPRSDSDAKPHQHKRQPVKTNRAGRKRR